MDMNLRPDELVAMMPAVVLDATRPGAIDEARKVSHDALIQLAGHDRRSGVWWTKHEGDEALQVLAETHPGDTTYTPDELDSMNRAMREALISPRAALVVAWCKMRDPNAPPPLPAPPPAANAVLSCCACDNWQIDVTPAAVSDLGGNRDAYMAAAEAHQGHIFGDCVGGTEGRIKVHGQWVDRPEITRGKPVAGAIMVQPLPDWWVWA